jgi:hypothetical protein
MAQTLKTIISKVQSKLCQLSMYNVPRFWQDNMNTLVSTVDKILAKCAWRHFLLESVSRAFLLESVNAKRMLYTYTIPY